MTILLILGFSSSAWPLTCNGNSSIKVSPFFSPNGQTTEAIVSEINSATKSIQVLAYSFTSRPIAEAITNSSTKGVQIEIIMDSSQVTAKSSALPILKPWTKIDYSHSIQHNKVMIIDGKTLITGSFNFSKAAEVSNAENLIIIKNSSCLINQYKTDFKKHKEHSK